jgi:glycosyltransferase involved in cell wall biosynthesis
MSVVVETWGMDYEIICVDAGSRDRTWELLMAQNKADARWRCLSLARNFGHQTAVGAGWYHASGDAAVIIDADLQDPPEEITRMLAKWREGNDVVFAVRKKRKGSLLKRMLAWGFYRLLAKMTPFPIPTEAGDFCLLDRKVMAVINSLSDGALAPLWWNCLKEMLPDFEPARVSERHVFRFKAAQHIVDTRHQGKIPDYRTPLSGINFSQIFLEDRGINPAVREGIKIADRIRREAKAHGSP